MASLREKVGSSFWTACFTDADGKKRFRSTGTRDRRQAQKIADAYEAAAQRKFTVAHVQRTLRELMQDATATPMPGSTVAEYFRAFIARRKIESAPATTAYYDYNARRFLEWCAAFLPEGGKTQVAAIQASHVEAFRAVRFEECSPATVNHGMKFLRQVFAAAKNEGMLLESPMANFGRIRHHTPAEIQPFTTDQVRQLLAVADEEWTGMILFALYTGQRLGDLALLDWKNLDVERGEVSFTMRKTKRRMLIPLAIPLVAHLAQKPKLERLGPVHPRGHHIITRDDGKSGKISSLFYRLMVKAGLVEARDRTGRGHGQGQRARRARCPFGFHSFRHTATSMLRDAGAPTGVAMELIGHSSRVVHDHYAHLGSDTLRRAVSLLPTL